MKTLEQIRERGSHTLDGRDFARVVAFLPESELPKWGLELKPEYVGKHVPIAFTRETVITQLGKDIEFGFEKALNKRGLSANCMHSVVKMWCWVLDDGVTCPGYAQYGLPLLKAAALHYGFPNPIGDDRGDEFKYSSQGDLDD